MYSELALYIDGKWLNGEGRKGEDVINPATGKALAHLPHASKADLDAALAAAEKGFAIWRATTAYDRAADYPNAVTLPLQFITLSSGKKLAVLVTMPADAKNQPVAGNFPAVLTQRPTRSRPSGGGRPWSPRQPCSWSPPARR